MAHRPLDPRIVNVCFDANAFDRYDEDGKDVERLLALQTAGSINLVAPSGVRDEMQRPHTPTTVRDMAAPFIFSLPVEPNENERRLHYRVRAILRGNATSGKHDADARHVCEAAKYGGYFITHDRRLNDTKRAELAAVLPASLQIVTLSEFLRIYDRFEEAE